VNRTICVLFFKGRPTREQCCRRGYRPRVISPQEKNSQNYTYAYCYLLQANKDIDLSGGEGDLDAGLLVNLSLFPIENLIIEI